MSKATKPIIPYKEKEDSYYWIYKGFKHIMPIPFLWIAPVKEIKLLKDGLVHKKR